MITNSIGSGGNADRPLLDKSKLFSLKAAISERFGVEVPSDDVIEREVSIANSAKRAGLEPASFDYTQYLRAARLEVVSDLQRDPIKFWIEIDASKEREKVLTLPAGCQLKDGFDENYYEARYSGKEGDTTKLKITPQVGTVHGNFETGGRLVGSEAPRIFDITKNGNHAYLYLHTKITNQG
ncbi:MAG: hypothetical protein HYY52_06785 [Candidatus Melainabacteria bacterium]|nr:hypothetical protein [Candidatus Melainabacteria bacterium]